MPVHFLTAPSLDAMLQVPTWTEDHIADILHHAAPVEGLHVDYKDGDWLSPAQGKDVKGEIRRYVGGFSNADGGALVIGISDKPVAGGTSTGKPLRKAPITSAPSADLEAWFLDAIHGGVYPALQPPASVHVITSPAGKFAVVLVQPSFEGLVSVRCGSRTVFPARIADRTHDLDEWAVRAVLLGTRRSPRLTVRLRGGEAPQVANNALGGVSFSLPLSLFNDGFVWAESPRWGIVTPGRVVDNGMISARAPLSPSISASVLTINEPAHAVYNGTLADLEPFASASLKVDGRIEVGGGRGVVAVRAALYVLARNCMPRWYAIELRPAGSQATASCEASPTPVPVGIERLAP